MVTQAPTIVPCMNTRRCVRIRVRGRIGERLASVFEGLTLVRCQGATELVGQVADQAQVHGILTRIRDLGMNLESVTIDDVAPAADNADRGS